MAQKVEPLMTTDVVDMTVIGEIEEGTTLLRSPSLKQCTFMCSRRMPCSNAFTAPALFASVSMRFLLAGFPRKLWSML